ncbi:MAG TPA: CHC2 zinc finger domain-containing protein [Planctomycetota bacterium]|nr:CHC2 zinc finger domain-containing protein [Planctomycetota bacterium]
MSNDTDKSSIKQALRLEDLVRDSGITLKRAGRDLSGLCPFHTEKTASFTVNPEGQFFKCFGCGKGGDVLTWIGWTMFKTLDLDAEQFRAVMDRARSLTGIHRPPVAAAALHAKPRTVYPTREKLVAAVEWIASEKNGIVVATYPYTNAQTKMVDKFVFRIETPVGKEFLQARPCGGGFCLGGLEVEPLYNRTRISTADTIIVTEGEKCVHALHETGHVATTSPGGSKAARKADWSPLAGKRVIIWPDADQPGIDYARNVQNALTALDPQPSVWVIDPAQHRLKDGEDAADVIDRAGPMLENRIEAVEEILRTARGTGPIAELQKLLEDAKSGRRVNVDLPWPQLGQATQGLYELATYTDAVSIEERRRLADWIMKWVKGEPMTFAVAILRHDCCEAHVGGHGASCSTRAALASTLTFLARTASDWSSCAARSSPSSFRITPSGA